MVAAFAAVATLFPTSGGVGGNVVLALGMLVLGLILFARWGVGGGVVKLFVAASLWIGPNDVFVACAGIMLVGGALWTLLLQAVRSKVEFVPYAPVVLVAFLVTVPHAPIWLALMSHGHASA